MTNKEQRQELIMTYLEKEMIQAYGQRVFDKIIDILLTVENGDCGVEMSVSTFPALLREKGIKPKRTYEQDYGKPKQDGREAATPAQRDMILTTLHHAGFLPSHKPTSSQH